MTQFKYERMRSISFTSDWTSVLKLKLNLKCLYDIFHINIKQKCRTINTNRLEKIMLEIKETHSIRKSNFNSKIHGREFILFYIVIRFKTNKPTYTVNFLWVDKREDLILNTPETSHNIYISHYILRFKSIHFFL